MQKTLPKGHTSCLSSQFKYTSATHTDVGKTFARIKQQLKRRAELRERAGSQEHFIDLCYLVGHPTPASADPKGWFCFDKGAAKVGGGDGWADARVILA